MASPVVIIGIVDCCDIVALSLVMTAYWDFSPVVRTLRVYGYGRVSIYMVMGFFPLGWLVPYCSITAMHHDFSYWALAHSVMFECR